MSEAVIRRSRSAPLRNNVAFWISATATVALLLTGRAGTLAAAGFIAAWGLYGLAWPQLSAGALFRTILPWLFPLVALASTAWSQAPMVTARTALEWLAITGIAIIMAKALPAERLLASWVLALVPVVILGGMLGGSQFTELGQVAAVGIFGSKNNFALHISSMFYVCMAVLAGARQPRLARIVALLGAAAAPAMLWRARSVGALLVFLPSLLVMCSVIALGYIRPHLQKLAVAGVLAIGVAAAGIAVPIAMGSRGALLSSIGKSDDLTGRGLLWQRAGELIAQRPVGGVGYAAFWLQGNPEAEALWRAEHIASRGGFHFHSFYYETLVELGYAGLAVGLACFVLIGVSIAAWALREPSAESGFFCAIVVFLLLRSFVELDLAGGFGITALLLPAGWIYARSAARSHADAGRHAGASRFCAADPHAGSWRAG